MRLEVYLYASLASHLPERSGSNSCTMDIAEGTSIEGLLRHLKIPLEIPKIIFLNGIHAEPQQVLKDGDRVAVFPPIAGG